MAGGILGALGALLMPSPLDAAKRAVAPNPYAPVLPAQRSIAVVQGVRGIRGGLTDMTGSEADYAAEQATGDAARGAPLRQWVPGAPTPPSRYTPRLPIEGAIGQGTGYYAGNSYKGWVVTGAERKGRTWGRTGDGINGRGQNAINGTLLDPRARAPLPRSAQAAYNQHNADDLRLEDVYGSES